MIRAWTQKLALAGAPDLRTEWVDKLSHKALVAQGAEQWTSLLGGQRVQRYAIRGKGGGPAVLLVHGLNGSSSSMAPLVRGLVPVSSRIALLDLPGHGLSPRPGSGPISVAEHAAAVMEAAEQLAQESGGKVVLVGNSMGGALSLHVARARPDLVAGVVGLNPAGADIADAAIAELPRSFPDLDAGARHMAGLLFKKTPLFFWLIGRDIARGWQRDIVQRILSDVRGGHHRALAGEGARTLAVPRYVLWGADDKLLPRASVDEFRAIPGARVEVLDDCGHMPQLEAPAVTSARVAEFVASLRV